MLKAACRTVKPGRTLKLGLGGWPSALGKPIAQSIRPRTATTPIRFVELNMACLTTRIRNVLPQQHQLLILPGVTLYSRRRVQQNNLGGSQRGRGNGV